MSEILRALVGGVLLQLRGKRPQRVQLGHASFIKIAEALQASSINLKHVHISIITYVKHFRGIFMIVSFL